LTNI